jgi:MYXO-CTERM domain-containing protein
MAPRGARRKALKLPLVSWSRALVTGAPLLACLLSAASAKAADYYVAPTGSDSAAGTMAAPFATLQKGHDAASAGDTVWLRGGTYQIGKQVKLSKSGQSDTMRLKFFAYQGEKPVFDFSTYVSTNPAADVEAIAITGSWLHLKGFEVKNVPMSGPGSHSNSGVRSRKASNNIFELLDIHHVSGPGLFIDGGNGGNLILNCDSHDNYDEDGSQGDGQNGDGFGVHYQESGPSTIIRGCRAWWNSDDGYDYISQEVPVITENSWAMSNGLAKMGTVKPSSGNGNGFKVGSSKTGIRHVVRNCVAWKNTAAGFYANHSSGGNTWYNNTSYNNGTAYNMLASSPDDVNVKITLTGDKVHVMRNNLGFPNKNTNMEGVDTKNNTWDLTLVPSEADFVSTSDADCTAPRPPSGGLPPTGFLKLKEGSKLIDKGVDVELDFVGTAPDLGAHEYGSVEPQGGGANGGAGGASSAGAGGLAAGASSGGAAASGGNSTAGGAPGAGGTAPGSAGATPGSAGSSTANSGGTSATVPAPSNEEDAGCTCTVGASTSRTASLPLLGLGALGLLAARRRRFNAA